jgi:hypothetical protein
MSDHTELLSALLGALVARLGGEVSISLAEIDSIIGDGLELGRDPAGESITVSIFRDQVLQ